MYRVEDSDEKRKKRLTAIQKLIAKKNSANKKKTGKKSGKKNSGKKKSGKKNTAKKDLRKMSNAQAKKYLNSLSKYSKDTSNYDLFKAGLGPNWWHYGPTKKRST